MSEKKQDQKSKPMYEAPIAVDLSAATATGQQYEAMGNCRSGTGPGYCLTGVAPVDSCSSGNGASASLTCYHGQQAASNCYNGQNVYASNCRTGTRPFNCATGSRA